MLASPCSAHQSELAANRFSPCGSNSPRARGFIPASAPKMIISSSLSSANTQDCCSIGKRKRRPAGTPDPDAEVVSLSPKTLMESDRYICEICSQGFQRDQNLQMHRRRHKVPWKLLKRSSPEVKKRVYVCPEPSCLHHDPCHALGDLVGIKKHYRRKHSSDKQWKCDKCGKGYAVQSDYKAHLKTCGTRGHCCDCGHVFSRVESFIEHQDNCTIAKEKAALGCSGQLSMASLPRRNVSPAQSADTTWSGVIRQKSSRSDDDGCQHELQLLRPDHPSQKPLPEMEEASPLSRYVQDPSNGLSLKLSIGLPSLERSVHSRSSKAMAAWSGEEANPNGEVLVWDLLNQKKAPSPTSRPQEMADAICAGRNCVVVQDLGCLRSAHSKLGDGGSGTEKAGFDILNFRPSKQSKLQGESKALEADDGGSAAAAPNSWLDAIAGVSCTTEQALHGREVAGRDDDDEEEGLNPPQFAAAGLLQLIVAEEERGGGGGRRSGLAEEAGLAAMELRHHSQAKLLLRNQEQVELQPWRFAEPAHHFTSSSFSSSSSSSSSSCPSKQNAVTIAAEPTDLGRYWHRILGITPYPPVTS